MINLIVNAQHALMSAGGERVIHLGTRCLVDRDMLAVSVEDSGPGIADDIKTRVFDPFFTTKPVGSGTGLGLSVSRGMIESHGGTIELCDSELGGACFVVLLPRRLPAEDADDAPAAARHPQRELDVLIVDDDRDSGEALGDMMRPRGYGYRLTLSAEDALRVLETTSFDVIVSDIRMPGMSGPEFLDEVRRRFPRYADRLVFVTGDVVGAETQALRQRPGVVVLEKPVEADDLFRALERLIAGARTSPVEPVA